MASYYSQQKFEFWGVNMNFENAKHPPPPAPSKLCKQNRI